MLDCYVEMRSVWVSKTNKRNIIKSLFWWKIFSPHRKLYARENFSQLYAQNLSHLERKKIANVCHNERFFYDKFDNNVKKDIFLPVSFQERVVDLIECGELNRKWWVCPMRKSSLWIFEIGREREYFQEHAFSFSHNLWKGKVVNFSGENYVVVFFFKSYFFLLRGGCIEIIKSRNLYSTFGFCFFISSSFFLIIKCC